MNSQEFLKAVDAVVQAQSKESLACFIRRRARFVPESSREGYLAQLKEKYFLSDIPIDTDYIFKTYTNDYTSKIIEILGAITPDSYSITADAPPGYNRFESITEFVYSDPQGVSKILTDAIQILQLLFLHKRYDTALVLGKILLDIRVHVESEVEIFDEDIGIFTLNTIGVLSFDENMLVNMMYCLVYMSSNETDKVKNFYEMSLKLFRCPRVSFENMLKFGNISRECFAPFAYELSVFLCTCTDSVSEMLVHEALLMLPDPSTVLNIVRDNIEKRPSLYVYVFDPHIVPSIQDRILYGLDFLDKVDSSLRIRSDIALQTSQLLTHTPSDESLREECLLAACESDTTPVCYLRYLTNSTHPDKVRKAYNTFINTIQEYDKSREWSTTSKLLLEYNRNTCEKYDTLLIRVFLGEVSQVFNEELNTDFRHDFSSFSITILFNFFIFLVYKGAVFSKGMSSVLSDLMHYMYFSKNEYLKGLNVTSDLEDMTIFSYVLTRWKQMVSVSDNDLRRFRGILHGILERRVHEIMENNRRNCYTECAEFIAALGEVEESWGVPNGKALYMRKYADTYRRKRLFLEALNSLA